MSDAGSDVEHDRWVRWHDAYLEPGSDLSRRLAVVQAHVRIALDEAPPGPIRVLSLCAGQGRDVLDVLRDHHRRADVRARLVELDATNAAIARQSAAELGGCQVDVVEADAGMTDSALGMAPADLLLLVGIFGNVPDGDIERTVTAVPMLCAAGGTVIWTRSRKAPDITPVVRDWFRRSECREVAFIAPDDALFSVCVEKFEGVPRPFVAGLRLFEFG